MPRLAAALEKRDLRKYFKRVTESGASSWTMLQNVWAGTEPREQPMALALALSQDYLGKDGACRVHGGGFAGTIQAYLPLKRMAGYRDMMEGVFGKGCVLEAGVRPEGAVRLA